MRRRSALDVIPLLAWPAIAAAAYYTLAIVAAVAHRRRRPLSSASLPAVSILKPVHGRDPHFYEAIRSYAMQDYPEFELLFGLSDPDDAARNDIERLAAEHPNRSIRIAVSQQRCPNGKVGVLIELAKEARYAVLVVSDSDIGVGPHHLRRVAGALGQRGAGLVTCLYRASSNNWPSKWQAIGIATEFAPSVLVARLLGVAQFALGSTMVFRAEHLRQIGGFAVLKDYLADDFQLGQQIAKLGLHVELSTEVVETNLSGSGWRQVWRRQLRWARTIRVSQTAGYYGFVVTHATIWAIVAALAGASAIALATLAIRIVAGLAVGYGVLQHRLILRYFYLMPFRDLWGFAVWLAGAFGNTVQWRDEKLHIDSHGRIIRKSWLPALK